MDDGGRRLSARSLARLQNHSLFRFQIQDVRVRERVTELQDMVVGARDEPDHVEILTDLVHDIEDEIQDSDARELYLLASLQHFTQEVTKLLDMDAEAELNPADMPSFADIFAREASSPVESKKPLAATSSSGSSTTTAVRSAEATTNPAAFPAPAPASKPLHPFFSQASRPVPAAAPAPTASDRTRNEQLTAAADAAPANTGVGDDEDDVACGVCFEADSLERDPIVICELCNTAVHQTCYRIAFVPEGDWYCHPCTRYLKAQDVEKDVTPTHELECAACQLKGGAMMPTLEGAWMHVMCSMFLPEIFVKRAGDRGDVYCGVEKLKARRRLRCCFCKKTDKGACAQCAYGKCVVAYHVPCALKNGIKFEFMEAQRHFGSGCLSHQAKFLSMDGLSADEADGDAEIEIALTPSPPETRQSPTAKQQKTKAKSEKKSNDKKKKARANSWEEKGTEKDEHVLISSGSESDEEFRSPREERRASVAKDKKSSGKKRQLKAETGDDASLRNSKKGRKTTLPSPKPPTSATHTSTPLPAVPHTSSQATPPLITQTRVFVPAYYPPGVQSGGGDIDGGDEYEYVMIVIQSQPIGMGIKSSPTAFGSVMCLKEAKTTNRTITEALRRGVLQDGDEVFAMNQTVLRNVGLDEAKHSVIPKLKYPAQCWFRTKRRGTSRAAATAASGGSQQLDATSVLGPELASADSSFSTNEPPRETADSVAVSKESKQPGENEGLSVDWPWFFLRSDGKIAMNLFWRSLDGAFFLSKINKCELLDLQSRIEAMVGIRFSHDHAEYRQVQDLLEIPKREFVPQYLVDFRKTRKQKQTFLSSDIFMGVSAETLKDEDDVDDQPPLAVGTVVTVAKRTWAGINKLGGAGRVRRVHEATLEDGRKRYTYDIAYVLGGGEKKVERKYISAVDLNKDADKAEGAEETQPTNQTAAGEKSDAGTTKLRLTLQVERSDDETLLTALSALAVKQSVPTTRIFGFQVSTENGNVHLLRKAEDQSSAVPRDLLLHKHFEVKLDDEEERAGDDADDLDDDNESDNEEDEIRTQLESLQRKFGSVLSRNQEVFGMIKTKIAQEYATKAYRARKLEEIRWKHHEQMYRDIMTARETFDASDDDNESDEDEFGGRRRASSSSRTAASKDPGSSDEENEDLSFGGLFVNKIKQEGDEICVLCELSGGDFAATSCGHVVHPQCAMYTPETFFKDGVCHGIDHIPSDRRSLPCAICQGRKGLSKIQCANKRCMLAYHISCAFVNGLLVRDPHYLAWCPKHLKGSGMAHEVELPEHIKKASGSGTSQDEERRELEKKRAMYGKKVRRQPSPAEKTTEPVRAVASSKTSKKRRRKSTTRDDAVEPEVGDGDNDIENEPSCARRLDVTDETEDASVAARVPSQVFKVNDVVMILPREWIGSNKPGGVARIRAVHTSVSGSTGESEHSYDITYVLSSSKEKRVEAEYVRSYNDTENESAASTPSGRKKSRVLGTPV